MHNIKENKNEVEKMVRMLKDNDAQNRENFLERLAKKADRPRHTLTADPFLPLNDLPETTLTDKTPEELLELAQVNSEKIHVEFKRATTATLGGLLDEYLIQKKAKSLLLPSFKANKWAEYGLSAWKEHLALEKVYTWKEALGRENLENANKSDVALGFADYLLAESGTITAASTKEQGRSFHFLPTHYVALVKKSTILPRMRHAIDRYEQALQQGTLKTSNINFITGPSNSGDIEMVLIVGVHGPLDMTYVVLEDL